MARAAKVSKWLDRLGDVFSRRPRDRQVLTDFGNGGDPKKLVDGLTGGSLARRLDDFPDLSKRLDDLDIANPGLKQKFLDDFADAPNDALARLY